MKEVNKRIQDEMTNLTSVLKKTLRIDFECAPNGTIRARTQEEPRLYGCGWNQEDAVLSLVLSAFLTDQQPGLFQSIAVNLAEKGGEYAETLFDLLKGPLVSPKNETSR